MRGVTGYKMNDCIERKISTHTPHARRDGMKVMASIKDLKFQLTRLMRGVTLTRTGCCGCPISFQLTRLMRGVTLSGQPTIAGR